MSIGANVTLNSLIHSSIAGYVSGPPNFVLVDDSFVNLNGTDGTFDEHQAACNKSGGALVKIDSATKHSKLIAHIAGKVSIAIDQ